MFIEIIINKWKDLKKWSHSVMSESLQLCGLYPPGSYVHEIL